MKKLVCYLHCALLVGACSTAQSEALRLTTSVPECRLPAGPVLPQKYQQLAKGDKQFAWIGKAGNADRRVSGAGWETVDGSEMRTWFDFFAADFNGDGLCDWYLNAATPHSSGGDRDTLNTLYLGQPNGYQRVGASIPANKPDELGFGQADQQQASFLFGEELAIIHDSAGKTNYFISALYGRHIRQSQLPGYRVMRWDAEKKTLRVLDKWQSGSPAAQVYAYFKAHGARQPVDKASAPQDSLVRFDAEVETAERARACEADAGSGASPHLLAQCKAQAGR